MINENLRESLRTPSDTGPDLERTRSTSSSYPEQGINSSSEHSLDVDQDAPRLDLSEANLLEFNHTSRSRSPAQAPVTEHSTDDSDASSADLFRKVTVAELELECKTSKMDAFCGSDTNSHAGSVADEEIATGFARHATHARDSSHSGDDFPGSPNSPLRPHPTPGGLKRSASQFSMKTVTHGLKRSRIECKNKVVKAYSEGVRRASMVRDRIKRKHDEETKQYSAWKAMQRKFNPGNPIKGKHEKGYGAFSMEKSRHGHDQWWKEGVNKYQAPEWIRFGKWFK